jgi:hypothetical protein
VELLSTQPVKCEEEENHAGKAKMPREDEEPTKTKSNWSLRETEPRLVGTEGRLKTMSHDSKDPFGARFTVVPPTRNT